MGGAGESGAKKRLKLANKEECPHCFFCRVTLLQALDAALDAMLTAKASDLSDGRVRSVFEGCHRNSTGSKDDDENEDEDEDEGGLFGEAKSSEEDDEGRT